MCWGARPGRWGAEPRQANVVKIAGNFMIASAIETMGESTALARSYGVEPAALLEILTSTLFAAPVYQNYGRLLTERKFSPAAFKLSLGLKDVGLALAAGQEEGGAATLRQRPEGQPAGGRRLRAKAI